MRETARQHAGGPRHAQDPAQQPGRTQPDSPAPAALAFMAVARAELAQQRARGSAHAGGRRPPRRPRRPRRRSAGRCRRARRARAAWARPAAPARPRCRSARGSAGRRRATPAPRGPAVGPRLSVLRLDTHMQRQAMLRAKFKPCAVCRVHLIRLDVRTSAPCPPCQHASNRDFWVCA